MDGTPRPSLPRRIRTRIELSMADYRVGVLCWYRSTGRRRCWKCDCHPRFRCRVRLFLASRVSSSHLIRVSPGILRLMTSLRHLWYVTLRLDSFVITELTRPLLRLGYDHALGRQCALLSIIDVWLFSAVALNVMLCVLYNHHRSKSVTVLCVERDNMYAKCKRITSDVLFLTSNFHFA